MSQFNIGTVKVLSADLNRWVLTGALTTGNIAPGNIVKFDGEAHLWFTVATIIDAITFETVENYNGAKALDTFHPYLVTRDFTPLLQLPEATQGDRNTADIYTRAMRKLDTEVEQRVVEGRLTTEAGVPVSITERVAQSTLYFTAFEGNRIALNDGTRWRLYTYSEIALALTGLTAGKNYDVYIYAAVGGVPTLELGAAWLTDTVRAEALAYQNGILVKIGAPSRRHIGIIRATGATTIEDSGGGVTGSLGGKRFVWNRYNQVPRHLLVHENTGSWAYITAAWRLANGVTFPSNAVEYVCGAVPSEAASTLIDVTLLASAFLDNNGTGEVNVGVGIDSSTVPSGFRQASRNGGPNGSYFALGARYLGYSGLGYHSLRWLEFGSATGSSTFLSNQDQALSGLSATLLM